MRADRQTDGRTHRNAAGVVARLSMLERDDADDLGRALVHELLTGADWVIYDNYIRRQLVPYAAHTALQHALQIVDVCLGLYCYYAPALGGILE